MSQENKIIPQALLFNSYQFFNFNELWVYVNKIISPNKKLSIPEILNYPDLYFHECSVATKDELLGSLQNLAQTPISSQGIKFLILKNIDHLLIRNSNMLLKFLEEIPNQTYVFATSTNLRKILKTILSRFQIKHLKPLSKQEIDNFFVSQNIAREYIPIVSKIWDGVEPLENIFNSNLTSFHDKLLRFLETAISDHNKFFIQANKLFDQKSSLFFIQILKLFFYDVKNFERKQNLDFNDHHNLLKKYSNQNFDYQKAIIFLNSFLEMESHNVNFTAAKTILLSNLARLYG